MQPLPANAPFTLVEQDQDTDQWRQWRLGGIGASDAPAIMGESPWKSAGKLRHERQNPTARSAPLTRAMARGIALEPRARAAYCSMTGIKAEPLCAQSKAHDWMRCSLDGLCIETMQAVEIKCGLAAYRHTARHRSVPRHYYGQLQHIMAVTGLPQMHFFCYLPDKPPVLITAHQDPAYSQRLLARETEFWLALQARHLPAA